VVGEHQGVTFSCPMGEGGGPAPPPTLMRAGCEETGRLRMRVGSLQVPAVVVCGGLVLTLCFGVRYAFGLFLPPMSEAHGWGRGTFSFALAIQNLIWGLSQPGFGMLADRFGVGRVLGIGTACYVVGLLLMPWSATP